MHLLPLIERLSIRTKDLRVETLQPNWAQLETIREVENQINAGKPVRTITLKARQLGISTITEALAFSKCFIDEGTQGLVVAHELEPSQYLLSMAQFYWETYPFKRLYEVKYESQKNLAWTTGSSLRITTASNAKAGRGRTIHFLHGSEVAFWPDPETTMLGLRQTIPNSAKSAIMLESTANGVGNYFYKLWQAAELNEVDYTPLFFPWHRHPEYKASAQGLNYFSLGQLDSEERALAAMGVSDDRLAWRRWAIRDLANNNLNHFHQEYPSTPDEAFIASGTNVFPIAKIRECYHPTEYLAGRLVRDGSGVRLQPDISGPLKVYKKPSSDRDWGVYVIAGDPTHTTRGDFACAQVISRRNLEQVAVWRGKIDPGTFAEELAKLGTYYNMALLVPEIEGPGYMTIGKLMGLEYPFIWRHQRPDKTPGKITDIYGWSTTAQSKNLAIGWLLKVITDSNIILHDAKTFSELQNYVVLDNGGYGPGNNEEHDDTVMALSIAVAAHAMESPLMAYGGGGDDPDSYAPQPTLSDKLHQEPSWLSWGEDVDSY